jgi:hypothetical protein
MTKKPKSKESDPSASSGQPGEARSKSPTTAKLPDYSKLFETITLPLASDYAKLFEGIKLPLAADYAKLFEPIALPLASDYAKLFEGIKLPLAADYAKLLEPIKLPLASDYAKLFAGIGSLQLPTSTETMVSVSFDEDNKLREEINTLRRNVAEHAKALAAATSGSEEQKREIEHLRSTIEQLQEKERLGFLLERVHPDAQQQLRMSREFQERFLATQECSAYVLSVDIRRSTELMLKARTAEKFAEFISGLAIELTEIVVNSLGVFDKFTGDGILAFFPDFFSGPDAAYRVLAAADRCHAAFEKRYHRSCASDRRLYVLIDG